MPWLSDHDRNEPKLRTIKSILCLPQNKKVVGDLGGYYNRMTSVLTFRKKLTGAFFKQRARLQLMSRIAYSLIVIQVKSLKRTDPLRMHPRHALEHNLV